VQPFRRRRSRLIAALVGLISVLFMQVALAGYRCPTMSTAPGEIASPIHEGQAGADCNTAPGKPSALCRAHCQPDSQSLDKPGFPTIFPFVAMTQASPVMLSATELAPSVSAGAAPLLRRVGWPSLAIQHCCFLF
jgi:hypothetical protein